MRRVMIVCLAMLLTLGAARQGRASEGFEDLVQLVKAGVNESTLLGYVNESPVAYALTVDEILYLSDLGMSAETIEAIDAHGRTLAAAASGAVAPAPSVATVLEQVGAENEPPAPGPGAVPAVEALPAQDVVQETVMAPPVETAPPADAADYSTFYETLAPYGNWVDLDGEWCWQPTTVLADPGWSPYCQGGHWVYTDYGWAWQSSYSWGWAPFHYGRWRHHPRYGWLWRPDRVWGPAWVCWRYSDEAIGWAPLPPEITFDAGLGLCFQGRAIAADFNCGLGWDAYTFVPVDRFSDIGVGRHRFERSRGERMFHSAGVVQNRIANQNGRLINVGPPLNRIAAVTHQDIHPVTIVAQNLRAGDPIPRPRLSGSTLTLFRPPIAPTAHENPRQVVVQSEARAREARHTTLADDVFRMSRNGINVQGEQARGRESRSTPPTEAHPREQSHQADDAARQHQGEAAAHQHQAEAAAHQHQAEAAAHQQQTEAAAHQHQAEAEAHQHQADQEAAREQQQQHASEAAAHQRQSEEAAARQQQQQRLTEQAAHQRQAEEAAARQQDEQRRRAADLIQQQNAARQQAQAQAKQQAAERQQHDAEAVHRQQDEQRRAAEASRQQEVQRQAQEAARQQERQHAAEAANRTAEAQREALRAQRDAEETAARRDAQARAQREASAAAAQPREAPKPSEAALPGYADPSTTKTDSSRGASSRGGAGHRQPGQ